MAEREEITDYDKLAKLDDYAKVMDLLIAEINPSQRITPFLSFGPLFKDYSNLPHRTYFETAASDLGRTEISDVLELAKPFLQSNPVEGQSADFMGMEGTWKIERRPANEKQLSWGQYFFCNHLITVFLATSIEMDSEDTVEFELSSFLSQHVHITINNQTVLDTFVDEMDFRRNKHKTFRAQLQKGSNALKIGLFKIAGSARMSFCLKPLNRSLIARVPLAPHMDLVDRLEIEKQVSGLRLRKDVFYTDEDVCVEFKERPESVTVQIIDCHDRVIAERQTTAQGLLHIAPAAPLMGTGPFSYPHGSHTSSYIHKHKLKCVWHDIAGDVVTDVTYGISILNPTAPLIGYKHMEARRKKVLEHFATYTAEKKLDCIWSQVACYALGRYESIDEDILRYTCGRLIGRYDSSDFDIHALLRLSFWERKEQHLSSEMNELIKETILGFRYWIDEPGLTKMNYGSENHRLQYNAAEYLAGLLFPAEIFTNSGQNGLFHAFKGKTFLIDWMRLKGKFGFDEWHSNHYYTANFPPLLNVFDFTSHEDYDLLGLTRSVLDYFFYNLAADTFHGVFGTTHGRTYGIAIKYPDREGTSATCWLLFGEGSLWGGKGGAEVSLATSKYRIPEILAKMAEDRKAVMESVVRQGLRQFQEPASFVVYRTPDYLLSALQDYRRASSTIHVGQVTLENKTVIFWSCPITTWEGSAIRPDYWAGNAVQPRTVQYRNVMSLTWSMTKSEDTFRDLAWMTHCFFEKDRFDEAIFEGHWVFGRVNNGYVGIYSLNGLQLGERGQYAGRELICEAPDNTWIVECGRQADWGSFDQFVSALKAASIQKDEQDVIYESPSIGRFVTGWDTTPRLNGTPIELRNYPKVKSPWAYSGYGDNCLKLTYEGEEKEIWFE